MHNTEISVRNKLSAIPKYIHATSSDNSVSAWRAWWFKYGLSAAPRHSFSPALPENLKQLDRADLVDPWRLHTSKCAKCRTVLKRARLVGKIGWGLVAWGALAMTKRKSFGALAVGLVGIASSLCAGVVIREMEGPFSKSEVDERTPSVSTS